MNNQVYLWPNSTSSGDNKLSVPNRVKRAAEYPYGNVSLSNASTLINHLSLSSYLESVHAGHNLATTQPLETKIHELTLTPTKVLSSNPHHSRTKPQPSDMAGLLSTAAKSIPIFHNVSSSHFLPYVNASTSATALKVITLNGMTHTTSTFGLSASHLSISQSSEPMISPRVSSENNSPGMRSFQSWNTSSVSTMAGHSDDSKLSSYSTMVTQGADNPVKSTISLDLAFSGSSVQKKSHLKTLWPSYRAKLTSYSVEITEHSTQSISYTSRRSPGSQIYVHTPSNNQPIPTTSVRDPYVTGSSLQATTSVKIITEIRQRSSFIPYFHQGDTLSSSTDVIPTHGTPVSSNIGPGDQTIASKSMHKSRSRESDSSMSLKSISSTLHSTTMLTPVREHPPPNASSPSKTHPHNSRNTKANNGYGHSRATARANDQGAVVTTAGFSLSPTPATQSTAHRRSHSSPIPNPSAPHTALHPGQTTSEPARKVLMTSTTDNPPERPSPQTTTQQHSNTAAPSSATPESPPRLTAHVSNTPVSRTSSWSPSEQMTATTSSVASIIGHDSPTNRPTRTPEIYIPSLDKNIQTDCRVSIIIVKGLYREISCGHQCVMKTQDAFTGQVLCYVSKIDEVYTSTFTHGFYYYDGSGNVFGVPMIIKNSTCKIWESNCTVRSIITETSILGYASTFYDGECIGQGRTMVRDGIRFPKKITLCDRFTEMYSEFTDRASSTVMRNSVCELLGDRCTTARSRRTTLYPGPLDDQALSSSDKLHYMYHPKWTSSQLQSFFQYHSNQSTSDWCIRTYSTFSTMISQSCALSIRKTPGFGSWDISNYVTMNNNHPNCNYARLKLMSSFKSYVMKCTFMYSRDVSRERIRSNSRMSLTAQQFAKLNNDLALLSDRVKNSSRMIGHYMKNSDLVQPSPNGDMTTSSTPNLINRIVNDPNIIGRVIYSIAARIQRNIDNLLTLSTWRWAETERIIEENRENIKKMMRFFHGYDLTSNMTLLEVLNNHMKKVRMTLGRHNTSQHEMITAHHNAIHLTRAHIDELYRNFTSTVQSESKRIDNQEKLLSILNGAYGHHFVKTISNRTTMSTKISHIEEDLKQLENLKKSVTDKTYQKDFTNSFSVVITVIVCTLILSNLFMMFILCFR